MTSRRIKISPNPGLPNDLFVDLNFELPIPHSVIFHRPLRETRQYLDLPAVLQELVAGLLSIEGVASITLTSYRVTVNKAELFDACPIAAAIANTFTGVYCEDFQIDNQVQLVDG